MRRVDYDWWEYADRYRSPRRGSTLSLIGISSHVYWAKYGQRWLQSISELDPQPDEVVLVTNFSPKIPEFVRHAKTDEPFSVHGWMNYARSVATGDYIGYLGLDDTMPTNALYKLTLEGDVIVSGNMDTNGAVNVPTERQWKNCLNEPSYTLNGYHIVHKDIAKMIPYRDLPWSDWVASLEFFQHNLDVRFEKRIRYHYSLHKGQLSWPDNHDEEVAKIELVKQMIRDGGIKPGVCFPPEPL